MKLQAEENVYKREPLIKYKQLGKCNFFFIIWKLFVLGAFVPEVNLHLFKKTDMYSYVFITYFKKKQNINNNVHLA